MQIRCAANHADLPCPGPLGLASGASERVHLLQKILVSFRVAAQAVQREGQRHCRAPGLGRMRESEAVVSRATWVGVWEE